MAKCSLPHEAVQAIESGHRVFLHGGVATPKHLIQGLCERASDLREVELIHLHTEQEPVYARPEYAKNFRVANLFVGGNIRALLDYDRVDYLPIFLSEIPGLFKSGVRRPDVALVQLSPPDEHGYCTLGTSVDIARAAVDTARIIIAQINHQMPRVHGDTFIHLNQIHSYIEVDEPLPSFEPSVPTEEERRVGQFVAGIIEDGSTLQLGIGSIPDAVAESLIHHRNLGIHSEMWSDGALKLIKAGAVNNSKKKTHQGITISSFVIGSPDLYKFIDDNPSVNQLGADQVNFPVNVMANPKVAAINSAVEVDLTGQICADSVGPRIISGVGGQMDFMRGASLSHGGKPIIAMLSRSKNGRSKIVPSLAAGAGVVTTRSHAHWVATEFGIVNLAGKTLNERAMALINIAHPSEREKLEMAWHDFRKKH